MKDLTVIYYSSNREKPEFEKKVQDGILKIIGNTPLISISHKPMKLGKNICVGDKIGVSDYNIYRQMQLGCLEATTKYVCTAEADCFYPPTGYFDFQPPEGWTAGHYTNVYILWKDSHVFNQKAFSLCSFLYQRFPSFKISKIIEGKQDVDSKL